MTMVWLLQVFSFASFASSIQSPTVAFETKSREDSTWWPFPVSKRAGNQDPEATRVQRLENDADVAYYGEMWVGGQKIKAIVDTGSFELLVFGKNCSLCGNRHLYDHSRSKVGNVTAFETSHTYGSGTCYSVEAFDKLALSGFQVPAQQFWEVVDAEMDILEEGAFQAIFGVGPPSSAVTFAEMEQAEVHKELKQLERKGKEITADMEETVTHYDKVVELMRSTTGVIEHLGFENMSFCFGKYSGSAGYVYWNDHAPRDDAEKFLTLDVVGDFYWSAKLGAVTLSDGSVPQNATERFGKALEGSIEVGCKKNNCSAVIDTGTSLIAAPSETVNAIYDLADKWEAAGGTCDDLSKLPELRFTLNGHEFVLPPESYMGVVEGSLYGGLQKYMPRLQKKLEKRRLELPSETDEQWPSKHETVTSCEPLVMTMDADSQFGQLWILGMPFFRTYYSSFRFKHDGPGSSTAASMSFSVADTNCRPGSPPNADATEKQAQPDIQNSQLSDVAKLEPRTAQPRPATMRVNAGKIRVPPFAQRIGRLAARRRTGKDAARKRMTPELDNVPFFRI